MAEKKKCCMCGKAITEEERKAHGEACQSCNQKTADQLNAVLPFPLFRGG